MIGVIITALLCFDLLFLSASFAAVDYGQIDRVFLVPYGSIVPTGQFT